MFYDDTRVAGCSWVFLLFRRLQGVAGVTTVSRVTWALQVLLDVTLCNIVLRGPVTRDIKLRHYMCYPTVAGDVTWCSNVTHRGVTCVTPPFCLGVTRPPALVVVHAEGTSSLSADVGPAAPAAPAAAATAASVLHTVVATTAARTQCDNIPVVCGKLVGLMLLPSKRIVVDAGTPQAREVSPTEFERLGGRGSRKRWRRTVFVIDGGWWS